MWILIVPLHRVIHQKAHEFVERHKRQWRRQEGAIRAHRWPKLIQDSAGHQQEGNEPAVVAE